MKELFKNILVPLLASRPASAFAGRLLGYGVPVFMLHRISPEENASSGAITPEHLRKCLDYLVVHDYTFISLERLVAMLANHEPVPPRTLVFTMDDGFIDQADIIAPIFIEYDCPLTFFVITGMLDQTLWPWDAKLSWITDNTQLQRITIELDGATVELTLSNENTRRKARHELQDILRAMPAAQLENAMTRLSEAAEIDVPEAPPAVYRPMDWDLARKLEKKGVHFAPHSVSHSILSQLDDETAHHEIVCSWETMQRELSDPLKIFCYPTGRQADYGKREIELLDDHGFLGAVSTTPKLVQPGSANNRDYLFSLPRLSLPTDMNDFIQYCTWIEYAKQVLQGDSPAN